MLDIKFIRENQDLVKEAIRKKGVKFELEELIAIDERRRHILQEMEAKRAEQNKGSSMSAGGKPGPEEIAKLKSLKEEIKILEEENKHVQEDFERLMLMVPQVPDPSVPEGKDDADNVEIRKWGELTAFDFEPKDHIELMESLELLDLERGTKVSGFRGYFLKNEAALLSHALWSFVLDNLVKKGFTPIIAPAIAREMAFRGTGWLPQGKDEIYKIGEDGYLIGTSEVSIMAYYSDEILYNKDLPKKFVALAYFLHTMGIFAILWIGSMA